MDHRQPHEGGLVSSIAAGAVMGIGIGAIASQSLATAVAVWLMSTSVMSMWAFLMAFAVESEASVRDACRATLAGGAVLTGVMGLLALSPAVFVIGIVVLGATPMARARYRAWWTMLVGRMRPHGDAPHGPTACRPLEVTTVITDEDLWRAWESSGRSLSEASTPEARLRDAEFRALVLDELDRRASAAPTDEMT